MAYSMREPGSQMVGQFGVPYKGTHQSIAIHQVAPDALYNSLNVFIRDGKLRERPGLSVFKNTLFNGPIIGGAMAVTPYEKRLLAIAQFGFYELGESDTDWFLRSSLPMALSHLNVIDIAFMETSGKYIAIIANSDFQLKQWDSVSHAVSTMIATTGVIPYAKSVCVASRRVVALIPPHTVVWSKVFEPDAYPPLAYNKIAQTNDVGICVKRFSNLSFIVYKERSIYKVRATGGLDDEVAFSFSEPIETEGPAGVRAVIDMNGYHVYMTRNGRVAIYDGSTYPQWVADGVWFYLQKDIDPVFSHRIFGVYDHRLHTIVFHYARMGDAGLMKGILTINLPLEGVDLQSVQGSTSPYSFLGRLSIPVSHGYEMRFNRSVDRSLLFSGTPGSFKSYISNDEYRRDDTLTYPCSFQTGLASSPDGRHVKASFESFLEREVGNGVVLCETVTSDSLESRDGTVIDGAGQYLDLETNKVQEYVGFDSYSRFFGLRYAWDSSSRVRYSGAIAYGKSIS